MQKCGGFVVELQMATNHSASILNCHGMPCRSVRTRAYNRSPAKVQRAPSGNLFNMMTVLEKGKSRPEGRL
jgi:hypothetical protein